MSDAAPDDRARKGLQQWMQTLYARLGIDLTDGDPRSPAERVAAAMYPTLEPREAMLAFHDMVRQHPAGAAAADAKLRAEAATVRWHVFEPGVQRALEARADEQGVPVPEVKVQLLMAAAWELERGTDLPLPPAAGERWIERPYAVWWQKACIALAEAALRGEAPLPRAHTSDADYPLEVALEPDAGEDRPEDLADDEGTASAVAFQRRERSGLGGSSTSSGSGGK